jgi:hypothetical protein
MDKMNEIGEGKIKIGIELLDHDVIKFIIYSLTLLSSLMKLHIGH